jgi:hypothetical protein
MGGDQKLRVCMGTEGIFGGAYIICSPRVPGHAHCTFSEDLRCSTAEMYSTADAGGFALAGLATSTLRH